MYSTLRPPSASPATHVATALHVFYFRPPSTSPTGTVDGRNIARIFDPRYLTCLADFAMCIPPDPPLQC